MSGRVCVWPANYVQNWVDEFERKTKISTFGLVSSDVAVQSIDGHFFIS